MSLTAVNIMLRSAFSKCCDLYCFHAVLVASFVLCKCYRLFSLHKNVGIFIEMSIFVSFFF